MGNMRSRIAVLSLVYSALGQTLGNNTDLICRPFGTCEPCPEDALHEPFCQPFGNRRLMHCALASSYSSHSPLPPVSPTYGHNPSSDHSAPPSISGSGPRQGEIPAWESCGRIVEKERADFYEFLMCNFVIAVIAVLVLFARSKRLQAMHARQLAARIGLVRGTPGGWANG
ncbi:uncharacterized protein FIBRA_06169 [Fibroporia radiculosa]|uniref:CDR ABC transporter domain-containing protein n=1 Tax=Fibroporia radiculosa TaxID=599839 RepID=J4HYP4_9APHY|nr:uncharacterized protein FIBRA_06169 [Fibroporia radiculosa]CCM04012.1 predicted protein [Fibroporia radiculosa]